MTDRPKQTVQKKTVKHKSKRDSKRGGSNILIYGFLIILIIAMLIVLSLTVFFKASEITVTGESGYYSAEQIITASGLSVGNSLLLTDGEQAERRIETQLPYISSATVKKKFPSSFEITVEDAVADRLFSVNGKYALAYGDKILEIVDDYNNSCVYYSIPVKEAVAGKDVVLESDISDVFTTVNTAIANSGIENITAVSFTGSVDIKLVYNNRILLDVGTVENINDKLKNAVEVIKSVTLKHGEDVEGTINLKYLVDKNNETYFTRESISQYGIIPETVSQESF